MNRIHSRSAGCVFLLSSLLSCGAAASNPTATNEPAPWKPAERKPDALSESSPVNPAAKMPDSKTPEPIVAPQAKAKSEPSPASTFEGEPAARPPAVASPTPASPSAATASEPEEAIVARVAGRPVYVSELLLQWMYLDPIAVKEQIDNLVLGRLFTAEAVRMGVVIDPDRRAQVYEQAVKAIEERITKNRPNMNLDRYVDRVLGLDPIRYRERLRDDALRQVIGERVMRAWLLSTEHAELHAIVVKSEEELKVVQDELAAGTSFEDVAKKHSVDEVSAQENGRMTPIVKSETSIGRLAFETKVGSVSAPKFDSGAWIIVRVDARPAPLSGDWSVIGTAVETSLADRPVDGLEAKQWNYAMLSRYSVDEKPFMELISKSGR